MTLNLSNTISRGRNALLVALLAAAASARIQAQGTETHSFTNLNKVIRDGNASGLSDVQTVTSAITNLTSVRLALHIAGEFNGDLYGYVRHIQGGRTNFCVLLNRVGRTVSNPRTRAWMWFWTMRRLPGTFTCTAASPISRQERH